MLSPLACVPRDGATLTMLSPLACVPRDGDSPTMLRPLACVPRDGGHPMPDSHPEITIRRSLVEAHSFVTPGQGAERPQPGDSSEQGKSASERLTSISDAHSQRTLPNRTAPRIHCSGRALCRPTSKNKRIICNACNNPPPNSRDARSSVRTNEQPNRIRSLTYVDKHNLLIIISLYVACGRSNERPYGLVG